MSKKLIITEEEKRDIKSLYNVREQFDMETVIQGLLKKLENNFNDPESDDSKTSDSDDSKTEPLDNITDKGQKLLDNQSFQDKLDEVDIPVFLYDWDSRDGQDVEMPF
jgi:hypothetical protein